MATWVVVIPDYMMDDHHVLGPFSSEQEATEWGRGNVGTSRAWFTTSITGKDQWKAT